MAWKMGNGAGCHEAGWCRKPLFVEIYAAVAAGIVFSGLFLVSSLYASGFYSRGPGCLAASPPPSSPSSVTHVNYGAVFTNFSESSSNATLDFPGKQVRSSPAPQSPSENIWARSIWDAPPSGSKMPSLKALRLTKETAKYRVKDNVLIVTFGNYAFVDFILNWVKHLTNLNVTNLVVGAMDTTFGSIILERGTCL